MFIFHMIKNQMLAIHSLLTVHMTNKEALVFGAAFTMGMTPEPAGFKLRFSSSS